jgi:hypothetical protein
MEINDTFKDRIISLLKQKADIEKQIAACGNLLVYIAADMDPTEAYKQYNEAMDSAKVKDDCDC